MHGSGDATICRGDDSVVYVRSVIFYHQWGKCFMKITEIPDYSDWQAVVSQCGTEQLYMFTSISPAHSCAAAIYCFQTGNEHEEEGTKCSSRRIVRSSFIIHLERLEKE